MSSPSRSEERAGREGGGGHYVYQTIDRVYSVPESPFMPSQILASPELRAKALLVHERLCAVYGCPIPYFHDLDPLSELVSSLLSHRTKNADSRRAFVTLRERFPGLGRRPRRAVRRGSGCHSSGDMAGAKSAAHSASFAPDRRASGQRAIAGFFGGNARAGGAGVAGIAAGSWPEDERRRSVFQFTAPFRLAGRQSSPPGRRSTGLDSGQCGCRPGARAVGSATAERVDGSAGL